MLHHPHVSTKIEHLDKLSRHELRILWEREFGASPPATLGRDVLALGIAYARQERRYGGLRKTVARELDRLFARAVSGQEPGPMQPVPGRLPRAGTILVREWHGTAHHVTVTEGGFLWNGKSHRSLSKIAHTITGTKWNGPRFFGLRDTKAKPAEASDASQ